MLVFIDWVAGREGGREGMFTNLEVQLLENLTLITKCSAV